MATVHHCHLAGINLLYCWLCVCEQRVDGHYVKSNPHSSSHMSNFLTVLSPRHILMEEQIRSVTEISSKKSGANKSSSVIK